LKGNEQETLLLMRAQKENGKLSLQFEIPSMRMVFPVRNRKSIFIYSWRLVCFVASCHALQSSVGSSALGMHLYG